MGEPTTAMPAPTATALRRGTVNKEGSPHQKSLPPVHGHGDSTPQVFRSATTPSKKYLKGYQEVPPTRPGSWILDGLPEMQRRWISLE